MILILSRESAESTTEAIIDWLNFYNKPYYRFNGEDLFNGKIEVNFFLDKVQKKWMFTIKDGNLIIKNSDISAVWFRRFFDFETRDRIKFQTDDIKEFIAIDKINAYHFKEALNIFRLFEKSLNDIFWLNSPSDSTDKLKILELAISCSLHVPETLITNNKMELSKFMEVQKNIITKATTDGTGFKIGKEYLSGLTTKIDNEKINHCKYDIFFPSLFQNQIKKIYEIRVFYLCGEFYSAAIFSQNNTNTEIDYRNYDEERPNRVEPIDLPLDIKKKINKLMNVLNMNCGSIDLMKSIDGIYYFLEVNPVGQFLGISEEGNFQLDKKVSLKLIEKSNEKEKSKY